MLRKTITLVTSNEDKLESFRNASKNTEINFERKNIDYPEDHDSNSTSEIAEKGANHCFEKLGEPVIVTDIGLFIDSLNGFPGVNTSFVLDTIGNQGLLKLLENEENRNAEVKLSIGYCDKERNFSVTASTKGTITEKQRGEGFGFDPVFRPKGFDKTFGEDPKMRDRESPRKDAIEKFLKKL
ncbi:MAG: non-canonical purine NTP pyrophosphatase [Nanohaloarchaea archaeon]|nr:non-canonical purine NTP pyrophosphatase [Candidatus Nanohaloarchaea archaeon]